MLQPQAACEGGSRRKGNPSVRCGGQLPLHSSAASGLRRGEPKEGATSQSAAADSSPYMLQPQAACEGGSRRKGQPLSPLRRTAPPFAPKRPFGTFRCCGRLIFRKEDTVLFSPKRSTFSRFAACERGAEGGDNPSVRCGRQLPLQASAALRPAKGSRRRGQPLSLLRQTAPLCKGSRRKGQPLSLLRQTAPLTFFAPK